MTATEILAEAAIAFGHDVKKTEVAGMAQRGGVVSSHLRFGPKVLSPQISPGTADVLLGFEAAEGMRWRHMLRPTGLALMNTGRLVPPVVDIGLYDYPDDPVAEVRAAGTRVFPLTLRPSPKNWAISDSAIQSCSVPSRTIFLSRPTCWNIAYSSALPQRNLNSSNLTVVPLPPVGPQQRRRPAEVS